MQPNYHHFKIEKDIGTDQYLIFIHLGYFMVFGDEDGNYTFETQKDAMTFLKRMATDGQIGLDPNTKIYRIDWDIHRNEIVPCVRKKEQAEEIINLPVVI